MTRHWQGITGERHPASRVTDAQRDAAIARVAAGEAVKAVAMVTGVTDGTVAHWLRQAGYRMGYVRR